MRRAIATTAIAIGIATLASAPTASAAPAPSRCKASPATTMEYCQGEEMYDTWEVCQTIGTVGVTFGFWKRFYCEWVPIFNRWQLIACYGSAPAEAGRAVEPS